MNRILLPGGRAQIEFLISEDLDLMNGDILVAGANSEIQSEILQKTYNAKVDIILSDLESLLASKFKSRKNKKIDVRLMDFTATDFFDNKFDLIFAQASISGTDRHKILKEFVRILKPEGYLCVGEIVKLKTTLPGFVTEILDNSGIEPLFIGEISDYYTGRGFNLTAQKELNEELLKYYSFFSSSLMKYMEDLPEEERKYLKKDRTRTEHEARAFVKFGGDKFIGFHVLLLKNKSGN